MAQMKPTSGPTLPLLAVVIPSYRVRARILSVLERIGPEVELIYVVDDACPEESGRFVEENTRDPRIRVIRNSAPPWWA